MKDHHAGLANAALEVTEFTFVLVLSVGAQRMEGSIGPCKDGLGEEEGLQHSGLVLELSGGPCNQAPGYHFLSGGLI